MKKILFSLLSLLLTLALVMPVSAKANQTDTSVSEREIVWQEGMTVEYDGEQFKTLHYALIAVGEDNLGDNDTAVINCKPNANVGGLHHDVVSNNLKINGNNAYVSDDKVPWISWMPNDSEHDIAIELGKDNVPYPLVKDINIEINELDGIAIWGGRLTEYIVNIELNDCQNMHKVMLPEITNSVDGRTDISLDNCSFKYSEDPKDYGLDFASIRSNYSGTISVTNTTFEGIHNPIDASNKFDNGYQEVIVKDSTFINCGTGGVVGNDDTTQIAAPIRVTAIGADSSAKVEVENCQFLGDNEKINGDILLGNGTFAAPAEQGSITLDMSNTKANVMLQKTGYYGEDGNVTNAEKAETFEVLEDQTISIDKDGNFNVKHMNVKHVESKDATCTEAGNIEYWYCADCGKYFGDEALEKEIAKEETVIKATGHKYDDKGKCTVCGVLTADAEEANKVDALIDAIGPADQVTLDSYDKIMAAKNAYEALSKEQKKLVTGVDDLNVAIDAYNKLKDEDESKDPADKPSDEEIGKPVAPNEDVNDDKDSDSDKDKDQKEESDSVKTGDDMAVGLLAGMLLLSGAGFVALRRKEK